jgi:hypothetical protein
MLKIRIIEVPKGEEYSIKMIPFMDWRSVDGKVWIEAIEEAKKLEGLNRNDLLGINRRF